MKKILLFLMLFTGMVNAQIVNIPDANFKAKLLAADVSNTIAYSNGGYQKIDLNNDGEIQVSEAQVIDSLDVNNSSIMDLSGIAEFSNLKGLQCANNQLSDLNVNGLIELRSLFCASNPLGELNLSGLVNLESLYSYNINLSTIDLSGLTQLKVLEVGDNALTNLDLSDQTNLLELRCGFNQIANLDLSPLINLKGLNCDENLLTSLNLSGLSALESLSCNGNQLTSLDVSQQTSLVLLSCRLNNLNSLFIKNGTGNGNQLYFDGNPNIAFICVDEAELVGVDLLLITYGYTNCVVNTYCTFTPGGDYNTISGTLTVDNNQDGCGPEDNKPKNIRVNVNDESNLSAVFTNSSGLYTTYTQEGNFEVTPSVEHPDWFSFSPVTAMIPFVDNNNNTATQDFCITANGVHHDAEMVISPYTPARPGFDAVYKLVYKNKGNLTDDLWLNFTFNDNVLDFVSSSIPVNHTGGSVQVMIPAVRPFESGSVDITLNVNSPTETPAVNIGDVLTFTSFVDIITDDNWNDNAFTLDQTVVGSYDPNDITCLEGDVVAPTEIGNYLHYAINFENTGTFPAENVVVKTVIDPAQFNIDTLQLMYASHPVMARLTGNVVEFIFRNIDLGIGGHGHILLKIKTDGALAVGSTVTNRADIFFDYNFPIDTGTETTVFQLLSNTGFETDNSVSVAPNPASDVVFISADNAIKSVEMYDLQGRIIMTNLPNNKESKLNTAQLPSGIYLLKISTERGVNVQRIAKD
ncbi:T9SS type A sorting domain-containing protein [Flavobacterium sp. CYK-4]|uniref:T9SS type A sorting domain-containing protein n=1 Tax=Flavobacterium lotistagni TaxID=2709660 RepID=UPI001409BF9C|nr:T9SS type A sorting domain-containing protein [Flavobacterium lotistagni]NHM06480.1 T9SS type A sorting domain-containing protein [Flavobacterium lotistagni]